MRLKTFIFWIISTSTCVAQTDRMPEFSWDTVPRYMHVRKAMAFTPEEIEYLATFPLLTFEKTTGAKEFGSTEAGTLRAAEAVKRINPNTKILYYRNILVHYGSYEANKKLNSIPHALLADQDGNSKLVRGKVEAYDLSNKAVESWWLDTAQQVCDSEFIDGVFVDGNIKALEPGYLRKDVGNQKKDAVETAYHQMMEQLPKTIGPKKLVLANIIRARFDDGGLKYLNYFDGSYVEGFEHAVGKMSREDYVAKGIAAFQTAARNGKIIAFTIGIDKYTDTDMDAEKGKDSIKDFGTVHDRFTYSLALFLVCAEKYSYFMASDGYGIDNGQSTFWMKKIPEYTKPLGAPKGPAVKDGYAYHREYEHANVMVDIQNETAKIIWKPHQR